MICLGNVEITKLNEDFDNIRFVLQSLQIFPLCVVCRSVHPGKLYYINIIIIFPDSIILFNLLCFTQQQAKTFAATICEGCRGWS